MVEPLGGSAPVSVALDMQSDSPMGPVDLGRVRDA